MWGFSRLIAAALTIGACAHFSEALAHGFHGPQGHMLSLGSPWIYFKLGVAHMLTGLDHLLFLFGVVFFLTKPLDIVKFITAFTLGHSITLIAATLLGIRANPLLIDAVIAVSVIYKGFENLDWFRLKLGVDAPNLLAMVFAFGLMHGFGLATRLQQYPLPQDGLTARLLAFNAGVEVGQIAALAGMFVVLRTLQRFASFKPWSVAANASLMIVGSLLLLSQLHAYQHERWPDDFPISTTNHTLDHMNNDIPNGGAQMAKEPDTLERGVTVKPSK